MYAQLLNNPKQLISILQLIESRREFASLLGISVDKLTYHIYSQPIEKNYTTFTISGKNKERIIKAPVTPLKHIQRSINRILKSIYYVKTCAHGFVKGRSIVTNAAIHTKSNFVLNIDLEDFFPSINFGRVRGAFIAKPFCFHKNIATLIAQICCVDNELPQGAPSSPIISNIICSKIDSELLRLAIKEKCYYSRYADDITFSTALKNFPKSIAKIDKDGSVHLCPGLTSIIERNGFNLNNKKTRIQHKTVRQEVTGLVVNKKVNVNRKYARQIRAMVHAFIKFGEAESTREHYEKYRANKTGNRPEISRIISGKISFMKSVCGCNSSTYNKINTIFTTHIRQGLPNPIIVDNSKPSIIKTEGKSDWKNLKAALDYFLRKGLFRNIGIKFDEEENDKKLGDDQLLNFCTHASKSAHTNKYICIFDSDNEAIIKKVTDTGANFKYWGGLVYSFVLPKPAHRDDPRVCIELYYKDCDLTRKDEYGRRIFLSNEFNTTSGRLNVDPNINCIDMSKLRAGFLKVIDASVFDQNNNSIALAKNNFALDVLNNHKNFRGMDFEAFKPVFEQIEQIIADQPMLSDA